MESEDAEEASKSSKRTHSVAVREKRRRSTRSRKIKNESETEEEENMTLQQILEANRQLGFVEGVLLGTSWEADLRRESLVEALDELRKVQQLLREELLTKRKEK